MLDLKFIRDNPDVVRKALENRQASAPLDEILKVDADRQTVEILTACVQ